MKIEGFYQGTTYQTPPQKVGSLSRLLPSLIFYFKTFWVVWRSSVAAKRGTYDSKAWYDSSVDIVRVLEETGCRFDVTGLKHLQDIDRPCIFIGNHMSTLETFVLPALIMPQGFDLTYVIKRSLVDYPVFGPVVSARDPIVVDRTNPREDLKVVMEEGVKRLEQGRSLIIFPQHTRSVDFDPKQFNSIGIKLARKAGALVIPVALLTWAWSAGRLLKDFGPIYPNRTIHFAFGSPFEVTGKGSEEQQRVITFIESNLAVWRQADGIDPTVDEPTDKES
ncbi:MAG: lysophospholipid acyltransferase family protein [Desulfuromonadales bacterium]